jgi:hypothetical protein
VLALPSLSVSQEETSRIGAPRSRTGESKSPPV